MSNKDRIIVLLLAVLLAFTLLSISLSIAFFIGGGVGLEVPVDTLLPVETDGAHAANGGGVDQPRVLAETIDRGEDYLRRIVFVGDSTTYHLIARGALPDGVETKQVWCPSNGTLLLDASITTLKIVYPKTGAEMTVAEASALEKPEYMVLTIGLNGAHSFRKEVYVGFYGKLIEAIKESSPETKIILQSVFPVAANEKTWTSLTPAELNLKIDTINGWAKELTLNYENVCFLDTQSVLRDGDMFLKNEYQSGDGIHLTADGYRAILRYVRTHAWD